MTGAHGSYTYMSRGACTVWATVTSSGAGLVLPRSRAWPLCRFRGLPCAPTPAERRPLASNMLCLVGWPTDEEIHTRTLRCARLFVDNRVFMCRGSRTVPSVGLQ